MTVPNQVKTGDIKAAMMRIFSAPEWALLFEVGNGTGWQKQYRFADAIAMSLWPSRGLELHGFEIKVSRADWRKERAEPEKAENIASYCDKWWLVTGPKVVEVAEEVPPAWGWMEFDGSHWATLRQPQKTEAKAIDRIFLAALLRRASKTDDSIVQAEIERRDKERDVSFARRVEERAQQRLADRGGLEKRVAEFEAASGITIDTRDFFFDTKVIGNALRAIKQSGIDGVYGGMYNQADELRKAADRIDAAMKDTGFARPLK